MNDGPRKYDDETFARLRHEACVMLGEPMVETVEASANRLFCEPEEVVRGSIVFAWALLMNRHLHRTRPQ